MSKMGKKFFKFLIKDKDDNVFTCFAYNDKAKLLEDSYEVGAKMELFGCYKDEEAEKLKNVWVTTLHAPQAKRTMHDQLLKQYGSEKAVKEALDAAYNEKLKAGFFPCKTTTGIVWRRHPYCINVNDVPQDRIEYLMDCLGTEYIEQRMSEALGTKDLFKIVSTIKQSKYEDLIQSLISEAQGGPGPND